MGRICFLQPLQLSFETENYRNNLSCRGNCKSSDATSATLP